jgi:hypothetical protein
MYVKTKEKENDKIYCERGGGGGERESAVDAKGDSKSPSSPLFSLMFYVM